MKMKSLMLLVLLFLGVFTFADEFTYPEIEDKCVGTYIPVDIDNNLKKTKLFYTALKLGYPIHHDVLFMGKNKCYSDARFHDGYAIEVSEFKNYRFVENDSGFFCLDDKGNSYKKISDKLNDYGYGYEYYINYILNVIFDFSKDMKNIEIKGDKIQIDNTEYSVILDATFLEGKDIALYILSEKRPYALVKNGVNGELHCLKQDEESFFSHVDEKIIKEFPLMFVNADSKFPAYWNLPRQQIRYLRNLIYARHGYAFKNQELKRFFENFEWYKVNPDFSEEDFNKEEKLEIKDMLTREEEVE